MITGDFLAMAYATDRVRASQNFSSWNITKITEAGVLAGLSFLAFCTIALAIGKYKMHLDNDHLRTFCVIAVVDGSQAITYVVRDRKLSLPPASNEVAC